MSSPTQMSHSVICRFCEFILIFSLLFIAFWIRVQGVEFLPAGQFTETDGYFYYWQASLISEQGTLPARDMLRWLPFGRDLGQTLNLYGYVLAYTHKAVATVFANISLYQVCLYMPVICFCIGLASLCLFLYHTHGLLFSCSVGILLATLPGSIERSTAGFGDRDAWCLMIGLLAVITYLTSLQANRPRPRILWTLLSGFTVFLGGISWEGFGVFLSVILCVEIYRFLSSETEDRLHLYLLWVCCFVPTLYLASPAYRNGYGFAAHLAAFVLVPPVVLLGIRTFRYFLMENVSVFRQHGRTLSIGLTILSVALACGYVWIQRETFADTTVPLSQNAVMQAMTELRSPNFKYWVSRYGTVVFFGCIGSVLIPLYRWRGHGVLFAIAIAAFTLTVFFRQPLDKIWGASFGNTLFGLSIAGVTIVLLLIAVTRTTKPRDEITYIAIIAWFLVWIALSRDARRYDFFIGVPLSIFTAELIQFLSQTISQHFKYSSQIMLRPSIAVAMLASLMFFPPLGAHATHALWTAKHMRTPKPEDENVKKTFESMKITLPNAACVAAHWGYGSQLNVLAGVKTIIDQDTYLQNWILLYHQHVHNATSESEALEYLKTHGATHLMLTKKDPRRSFLRGDLSDAFRPVSPKTDFDGAPVKVWEIHYPPDIKTNPKYLLTGFPEIDADLDLR